MDERTTPTPIYRTEYFLDEIVNNSDCPYEAKDRVERFLARIAGEDVETPEPMYRIELYLAKIAGDDVELPTPQSRTDRYLAKIAGEDIEVPEPMFRIEFWLAEWAEASDTWTWEKIVRKMQQGKTVPNGVEFTVHNEYYGDIDFIVRRSNVDKVSGSPTTPTTTIQCKYLLSDNNGNSAISLQYDRPEAFTAPLESAIAANKKVKFSLNIVYGSWTVGSYQFTPTAELPAGTALCMSGYQSTALTALKVQAYTDRTCKTKIGEWDVSASDGTEDVDLGNWQNHPQRVSYGSNNEAESNVFQMLNGIGLMRDIWEPKTPYDLMTTNYNNATRYGFLGGFPEEFRQHLGLALIDNITNTVFECPPMEKNKAYQHTGYIWLPSRKEIYGDNENANEEGETQFPYFEETGTTDADKLMYAKNAVNPTSYWLRTPNAGTANHVRICYTGNGGGLYYNIALNSNGLGPLAILVP